MSRERTLLMVVEVTPIPNGGRWVDGVWEPRNPPVRTVTWLLPDGRRQYAIVPADALVESKVACD